MALAAALLALPAGAGAATPARVFNAPGQGHNGVCLPLATAPAALRFGDGSPTGYSLAGGVAVQIDDCPIGSVRIDLHEVIPSPAGPLVFHRGGIGYDDRGNVKYGEIAASDLSGELPQPEPSSGGRGAECPIAPEPAYAARVESIPAGMHYKRPSDVPSGSNAGATFMHYGDPGADQGDLHEIHYSYLLWSFVDVRGGGMVRTLIAPGQAVRPCDVHPIVMNAWDKAGNVDGTVTARYVRLIAGSCRLYGWMVWSHDYFRGHNGPVPHATPLPGTPPAAPAPDPDCPVAAPAEPPRVSTGTAVPYYGAWTVTGKVDPEGTPAMYRFEVGTDRHYGLDTNADVTPARSSPVDVSGQITDLKPGTLYHYRLVAATTHGTSYGPDRTLSTPFLDSRLGKLRVAPKAFRRARSSRRAPAHIRFKLSQRAKVTLTFARRTAVRCGRRRCARWVAVPGRLRVVRNAGHVQLRFGGWLRGRPLAPGAYRVTARPSRGSGAQHVRFTLRAPRRAA
jgi:hypothetical protein